MEKVEEPARRSLAEIIDELDGLAQELDRINGKLPRTPATEKKPKNEQKA